MRERELELQKRFVLAEVQVQNVAEDVESDRGGRIEGHGTPAPWDPTERMVVRGPYRHVRNPMISAVFMVLAAEALLFFGNLGFWEALLLAAILVPTDAALGQAVVSNKLVPVRIRQALNVESGLNDGIALPLAPDLIYYLLNKPPGVVCTNEVREIRPRAIDLITDRDKGRIYTVGRLDEDSEGLILLTNDGTLANVITHPRYEVDKTYKLLIRGSVTNEAVKKIEGGVSNCSR